jgi:hypothetical protein
LTKNEIEKGEAITGYGQIDPGISSVPVTVVFTRPDGTVDKTESRTYEDGSFTFSYIPQDVGDWTVSIRCSGASYIMQSVELLVKVVEKQEQPSSSEGTQLEQEQQTNEPSSGIPIEHIIAMVLTLIVLVAVTAYLFINRRNKSSPVVISD